MIEARNGKEALQLFPNFQPDLVLTDIHMPETDGFELLPEIRRRKPSIKIIACSGGGQINAIDVLKTAKLLGANRILPKPFSIVDLIAAVESLVGE